MLGCSEEDAPTVTEVVLDAEGVVEEDALEVAAAVVVRRVVEPLEVDAVPLPALLLLVPEPDELEPDVLEPDKPEPVELVPEEPVPEDPVPEEPESEEPEPEEPPDPPSPLDPEPVPDPPVDPVPELPVLPPLPPVSEPPGVPGVGVGVLAPSPTVVDTGGSSPPKTGSVEASPLPAPCVELSRGTGLAVSVEDSSPVPGVGVVEASLSAGVVESSLVPGAGVVESSRGSGVGVEDS